jgi:prepilin-type N-terminal cleavage/methylation domain-containing protein/prepilin-type processing-associated H-X9-DG protein
MGHPDRWSVRRAPKAAGAGGFTLVEMLVVIAVISILAALLFPVFAAAREKARQTTCLSNLRQLTIGIIQYTDDYNGRMPCAYYGDYGIDTDHDQRDGWIYYSQFVSSYNGNLGSADFDVTLGSIYPYVGSKQVYVCPDDGEGRITGDSFAINSCVEGAKAGSAFFVIGKLLAQLNNPSGMMLLGEEGDGSANGSTNDGYLDFNYAPGGFDTISDRHNGGSNLSFVDGHTRWLPANAMHAVGVQTGEPNEQPGVQTCSQ